MSVYWDLMRGAITSIADDDWADVTSDPLPTTGIVSVSYVANKSIGKTQEVEFVVVPYTAATGIVPDNAGTFDLDVTLLVEPPLGSLIGVNATEQSRSGNAVKDRRVAIKHTAATGLDFLTIHRLECSGAEELVLRLHNPTSAPGDRWEVWWREVQT